MLLNKHYNGQWFETTWRSCDVIVMSYRCTWERTHFETKIVLSSRSQYSYGRNVIIQIVHIQCTCNISHSLISNCSHLTPFNSPSRHCVNVMFCSVSYYREDTWRSGRHCYGNLLVNLPSVHFTDILDYPITSQWSLRDLNIIDYWLPTTRVV